MNINEADDYVKENFDTVGEEDLSDLMGKEARLFSMLGGVFASIADDIKLMFSLAKDYHLGNYTNIQWEKLAVIVFSLLYLIMPFDVVPDFIPIVGYADDFAVITVCLKMIGDELKKYQNCQNKKESA